MGQARATCWLDKGENRDVAQLYDSCYYLRTLWEYEALKQTVCRQICRYNYPLKNVSFKIGAFN